MNYKLELNMQEPGSKIVFNNIIFDSFKVNIVERHIGSMRSPTKLDHVLFKVRTLDDDIIKSSNDNGRIRIKGGDLEAYQKLIKTLDSRDYKNKLIKKNDIEKDYVYFILGLVISNYTLN